MAIIVKSNIKKIIRELDKEKTVTSVGEEVGAALDEKVRNLLADAIKRTKANQRRTLLARDL